MALLLHTLINDNLPADRRQNQKGWWQFKAVCCHHRGHDREIKGRGNFLQSPDGTMVYNCYNCGFKAMYNGTDLTSTFETWMSWLGIPANKIQEAKLEILAKKLNGEIETISRQVPASPLNFPEIELPTGSIPLTLDSTFNNDYYKKCLEYINSRGRAISENWEYYWTPLGKNELNRRIIIPFKYNNKIVGWTGRYYGKPPSGVPRYFNSNLPQNYLFNSDILSIRSRKYILISEGPLDAIAISGISPLGSTMNKQQIDWLNSIDKEKIIVPDRELKNQELIDVALNQGWSVSFPSWETGIKDSADAAKLYGLLYTIHSIIKSKTTSQLEISFKRQLLKG